MTTSMGKHKNVTIASHRVTTFGVITTRTKKSQMYANEAHAAVVINTIIYKVTLMEE